MSQKKKLDSRIPTLIQNGVKQNQRSFFCIIGDRGRDQVVTLHYLLSKQLITRPSVLWLYKKELGFSSHTKKRMNQIQKEIKRGTRQVDDQDPFELFITSTQIRYCYYKEADRILGTTFQVLVLQDFEAITPNLLAKTIETIQGGGIVILLLKTMSSLKQLYTMTMDIHLRYRTEQHQDTVARFNERFILSLGNCDTCLVVDDELNVLPISNGKDVKPIQLLEREEDLELKELKESLKDTEPIYSLVKCTKTIDQAKVLLHLLESISEKGFKTTVSLTAARGRGKSASLGLSIAGAILYGYSNIFITSPSPENLKTLFEFILKGFDAAGLEEHLDYDILTSTDQSLQKGTIVRINVFKNHRQTIQWIQPSDYQVLKQAELVVIDEAAAIPLPVVKQLIGDYLVFMSSTINGYEGTGRALSLKLLKQLREQSVGTSVGDAAVSNRNGKEVKEIPKSRSLKELKLEEPIRYAKGDPVETWLNKLLCLDCCNPNSTSSIKGCPHPNDCQLYYVSRDTLFSYHPVSEMFLEKVMTLFVSSHYKNQPNDLQLLSDAPAHHLFVLLPPTTAGSKTVPDPLCVIQVCMEGQISKESNLKSLEKGVRPNGDLIPWVVTQQFQDDEFGKLSGARIVRIATHADYGSMGYGSRALQLLEEYYSGKIVNLDLNTDQVQENVVRLGDEELRNLDLKTDTVGIRSAKSMPPLLLKLNERPPREYIQWLGVSYGITNQLQKFWKRAGYIPVYLRQTANDLTGEHTCIMLKQLQQESSGDGMDLDLVKNEWLPLFTWDFRKRFIELLSYQFRSFSTALALSVLQASETKSDPETWLHSANQINQYFSPHDLKRLASYSQNLLDYHVIMDLVPIISKLYFMNQLKSEQDPVQFSAVQAAILVGLGLQKKNVEDMELDLGLSVSQVLAIFAKAIKKASNFLETVIEKGVSEQVEKTMKTVAEEKQLQKAWEPTATTLDEELEEAGNEIIDQFKEQKKELIDSLGLDKYAIGGTDEDWQNIKPTNKSKVVAIPNQNSSKKRKMENSQGTADAIIAKNANDGVFDPKGLVNKIKQKKNKMKQKQSSKRLNK